MGIKLKQQQCRVCPKIDRKVKAICSVITENNTFETETRKVLFSIYWGSRLIRKKILKVLEESETAVS